MKRRDEEALHQAVRDELDRLRSRTYLERVIERLAAEPEREDEWDDERRWGDTNEERMGLR